jgi:hypothetical protein
MFTLVPVLFLPVHKFSFYLTLPLVGIVMVLGYLLEESRVGSVWIGLFIAIWTVTSILSLRLTIQTNWITQGEVVSSRAFQYFNTNAASLSGENIYFIDTSKDSALPWSPTEILRVALSDRNFFDVYYPNLSGKVNYAGLAKISLTSSTKVIESRQFLGY